jgi:hypothetical protein
MTRGSSEPAAAKSEADRAVDDLVEVTPAEILAGMAG